MGLDITAHRGLTKAVGNEAFDETGELIWTGKDDDWFQLYVNDAFPGQAEDIEDQKAYKSAESFGFRAGSYGGYNVWRNELAQLAGYESDRAVWAMDTKVGPFVELINFSDCEGVIGATVSAKLAKDFAAYQEKADQHPSEYFRQKYAEWRKAFEMAADGGCVDFH